MSTSAMIGPALAALGLLCIPPSASVMPVANLPAATSRTTVTPRWRGVVVVFVGVLAVGVLFGLWTWWIGVVLGAGIGALTLRLPQRRSNADRERDRGRLAVHADLLAACLHSGMSVGAALLAVSPPSSSAPAVQPARTGSADGADPFVLLDAVAALLLLGADPDRAWRGAMEHPDLVSLAAAARRTATGGATFADAVKEHAVVLRASAAAAAERSAGRAGVAITAPLGLCFLPAFLCLGLAPVVIGLLSSLHLF